MSDAPSYNAKLVKPTKRESIEMANSLAYAINALGGTGATGRALGVTAQAISQWDICPPLQCRRLEKACLRKVTRYQLRPDVFGDGSDV
jgi:DNA-binding transcriptional regulator YdaS (Cro superfamily)